MKFEIDDKTGFLLIEPENGIIPPKDNAKIYCEQLEQILQAVKKTQAKLVNKQIQNIQDSKNPPMENWGDNERFTISGNPGEITYVGTKHPKSLP